MSEEEQVEINQPVETDETSGEQINKDASKQSNENEQTENNTESKETATSLLSDINKQNKEENKEEIKLEDSPPENYTYKNSDTNGEIDDNLISALAPSLKEAGVTNNQFTSIADSFAEYSKMVMAKNEEVMRAETKADPDLGGVGFDAKIGIALNAVEVYGGKELMQVLDNAGLGNNKHIIKAFYNAGKELKEENLTIKGRMSQQDNVLAELYPTQYENDRKT